MKSDLSLVEMCRLAAALGVESGYVRRLLRANRTPAMRHSLAIPLSAYCGGEVNDQSSLPHKEFTCLAVAGMKATYSSPLGTG